MTFLVRTPPDYPAERRYVLDLVFREWLGHDYALVPGAEREVVVGLADDPQRRALTLPDVLFATPERDWLTERSTPSRPLPRRASGSLPPLAAPAGSAAGPRREDLPILYGSAEASEICRATPDGLCLAVDVFGSVFYLLTRCEELIYPARDRHDRFPADASLAAREGFLERPLVDEYVDLLWGCARSLWPALTRPEPSLTVRLTHDVDEPWAAFGRPTPAVGRAIAGDLLRRRDPGLAARRARALADARLRARVDRDPLNTFDFLMQVSERNGLSSTFYFMAGNSPGDPDFRYRLSDPPFADLLRRIHARGHQVGLHGSYGSHRSAERLRLELDALKAACRAAGFDQPTWEIRQHYLRLANPETWSCQEAAGLDCDSTLGYAERIGLRASTCRSFPLFDLRARRALQLRERPLIAMDVTLLESEQLGFDATAARIQSLVNACRGHPGEAVVLVHNNTLAQAGRRARYTQLVEALVHG